MNISSAKEQICEIGRRLYAKQFVSANEGNLSIRVSENEIVCTPTLICKGYMTPDDLCVVDAGGNQIGGTRKPTSEIRLHLEIYRQRADIGSVVHSHPPHATAFAITREPIPTGVLPEAEIFLGTVPMTVYETPGTQKFAESILPFVKATNAMVLANHGTVSYDVILERAFWLTEILESYCRTLILARQLGAVCHVTPQQAKELQDLRKAWGLEVSG